MTEPDFPATPAGVDRVIRRGNLRRLRSAATTGVTALAVTGVVVLAPWQGPGGRDSLTPARDPFPTASASPTPGTAEPSADPTATPTSEPTRVPAASATALVTPPTATAPSPETAPSRRTSPSGSRSPITRGTSSFATNDLCQEDQGHAPQGWCLRYTGPTTARRGVPVTLQMELCRLGTFPAQTLTFGSTREITMVVDTTGWEAGQGEGFTSPGRTVTVEPGTCLTWASTWDTRGADGFLVLPGSYGVGVGIEASGLALSSSSSDTLDVSE